jgi:hypothetical protein
MVRTCSENSSCSSYSARSSTIRPDELRVVHSDMVEQMNDHMHRLGGPVPLPGQCSRAERPIQTGVIGRFDARKLIELAPQEGAYPGVDGPSRPQRRDTTSGVRAASPLWTLSPPYRPCVPIGITPTL